MKRFVLLYRDSMPGGSFRSLVSPTGNSLLEVLVALTCTGLLAAGTMPLLVDGARAARQRHSVMEAQGLADVIARTLARDVEASGRGLEGATSIERGGAPVALVEVPSATTFRLLLPVGSSREVRPTGIETYWVDDTSELVIGGLLAAVGMPDASPGEAAPGGLVATVRDGVGGGLVEVVWQAAESSRIRDEGPPRALLPLRSREYEALPDASDTIRIRRRDQGGSWQPVADGLAAVDFTFALDVDGNGRADGPAIAGPIQPVLWPYIHRVVIRVSVAQVDGGVAAAEAWAGVGAGR